MSDADCTPGREPRSVAASFTCYRCQQSQSLEFSSNWHRGAVVLCHPGVFGRTVTSNGSPYAKGPLTVLSVTSVYCGQTVGWSKMPFGTEISLGPDHIVLDGDPAPPPTERGTAAPTFRPMSIVAERSPISATAELWLSRNIVQAH